MDGLYDRQSGCYINVGEKAKFILKWQKVLDGQSYDIQLWLRRVLFQSLQSAFDSHKMSEKIIKCLFSLLYDELYGYCFLC